MYDNALASRTAYAHARSIRERLGSARAAKAAALAAQVDSLAPAKPDSDESSRRGARTPRPEGPPTLKSASDELIAAAMAMQGADIAPTASEIAACRRATATYRAVMARWNALEKEARTVTETN